MAMQVISSEDHYTIEVVYAPGVLHLHEGKGGHALCLLHFRTLADPEGPKT